MTYRPSVIYDATEASVPGVGNQAAAPKILQWLTTNKDPFQPGFAPSQTSHAGHLVLVESQGSAVPINYRMTVTAEFQFRKPLSRILSPSVPNFKPEVKLNPLLAH